MRVGIHQPMYLPWCGLFDRIYRCDIFVVFDNVPYSKNYFINRNKIKTSNGWLWLTIPVLTKGSFGELIKNIKINNNTNWEKDHWKSIFYSYKKAPFFEKYSDFFKSIYEKKWENLIEVIDITLQFLLQQLNITTKILKASQLELQGSKEMLVLEICKKLNATEYLSGPDGRNYLTLDLWKRNNIKVAFHDYNYPVYPQQFGDFIPNMSVIDLLFNCGDKSLEIITKNQKIEFV